MKWQSRSYIHLFSPLKLGVFPALKSSCGLARKNIMCCSISECSLVSRAYVPEPLGFISTSSESE
uniref:Uncharacterized protein n=1 Tax=Arundo donax TaxID=35708 RepID=A0A0A9FCQ2_ARUDO